MPPTSARKSLSQFLGRTVFASAIILSCLGAGEILGRLAAKAGFALPGSVIGMVILFALMLSGVVRLERVAGVAGFLLEYLGLFFVPAGVALLARWHELKTYWLAVLVAIAASTVFVLWTTGMTAQKLNRDGDEHC